MFSMNLNRGSVANENIPGINQIIISHVHVNILSKLKYLCIVLAGMNKRRKRRRQVES